jgi:transposase
MALTGDRIASLRAQGKTVREIAAEHGVSTTTVYRWADPGYAARQNASHRRYRRRNPERERAARQTYLERTAARCLRCGGPLARATAKGDPVRCGSCLSAATAERRRRIKELSEGAPRRRRSPPAWACPAGLSPTTCTGCARGESCRRRAQNGFGPELERELIALYEDGWPLPEIARSLGRGKRTITRQLARLRARGLVESAGRRQRSRSDPERLRGSPRAGTLPASSASSPLPRSGPASNASRRKIPTWWRASGSP